MLHAQPGIGQAHLDGLFEYAALVLVNETGAATDGRTVAGDIQLAKASKKIRSDTSEWQKQAFAFRGKPGKSVLHIITLSLCINGIHYYGINCDIVADGQGTLNGIGQKHLADSLALYRRVHSESATQRSRYRVFGQFPGQLFRQKRQIDGERAERIIRQYSRLILVTTGNEHPANPPFYILGGLAFQIMIQGRDATGESSFVVMSG